MAMICRHGKGCHKQATFNKARKTSGQFCGEHKKDGMISVMYTHYNNQVDHVFKRLPEALQWEILVEFVGGYVVRYNRLKRLMSGGIHEILLAHNYYLNNVSLCDLWLKRRVEYPVSQRLTVYALNPTMVLSFRSSDGQPSALANENHERLRVVASVEFSRRRTFAVLFQDKYNDRLSYGFTCSGGQIMYITEVDDSLVLPTYKKHIYPSYPNTNKKLGRPALMMKLHNPLPVNMVYGIMRYK